LKLLTEPGPQVTIFQAIRVCGTGQCRIEPLHRPEITGVLAQKQVSEERAQHAVGALGVDLPDFVASDAPQLIGSRQESDSACRATGTGGE